MSRRARLIQAILACTLLVVFGCSSEKKPGPSPAPQPAADEKELTQQQSLDQIQAAITKGQWKLALQQSQQHLLRHPDDVTGLVLAAQASAGSGDRKAAIELLDEAIALCDGKRGPSPVEAVNLRLRAANLLAEQGQWRPAIARLKKLIEEFPDSDPARRSLATMLNLRGYRFDANEQIRELCRRGGATPEELRGLIAPARTFTTFAEKPDPSDGQQIRKYGALSMARALFGEGDVRDALKVLENCELIKEKDPAAIAFYGQVLLESQQYERFESWLDQATPECRRYPAYWMAVGGWALHQRNPELAVRLFAEAVVREPGDRAANFRLTQALGSAGQVDLVKKFDERNASLDRLNQMTKTLLQNPNPSTEAFGELSDLLVKLGRPLESLAWYQLALLRVRASPAAIQQLAAARKQLATMNEAQARKLRQQSLCGLDLNDYPLDESWLATLSASSSDPKPSMQKTSRKPLAPVFVNVAPELGLEFQYRNARQPIAKKFRVFEALGAGVACLDYDNDGWIDLYVGQAAGDPPGEGDLPNLLARNLEQRFQTVTLAAAADDRGYTCGVTVGDWNQDGFADLVVGNLFANRLLINQGDGTFREHPGDDEWRKGMYTTALAMADVDGDHLPDIIEVNYLDDEHIFDAIQTQPDGTPKLPGPLHFRPARDRVFRSLGDGRMRGQRLGDQNAPVAANGLGIVVTDIDGQPGNEIFVANDLMANHLWYFQSPTSTDAGPRSWIDMAVVRGVAFGPGGLPLACMGVAAADFDENGKLDLHITNFDDQWSNHYLQSEDGFTDLALPYGFDRPTLKMLGFGTQPLDYDNNTTIDLVIGNGHIEDFTNTGRAFEMPTQLFSSDGTKFQETRAAGDNAYWSGRHLSRGLATLDWNNDGRTDFVVTDLKKPIALLENRTETPYHHLQLELVGTGSEREAIGASVVLSLSDRHITRVVQAGDGYMAKNEPRLSFGLGESKEVDKVEITWPSGHQQTHIGLPVGRWLIVEGQQPHRR